jgi:hypothetical protein
MGRSETPFQYQFLRRLANIGRGNATILCAYGQRPEPREERTMMEAATKNEFDVGDQIVAFKRKMRPRHDVLKKAYDDVRGYAMRAADEIRTANAAGKPTVPELSYADIKAGKVSDATRKAIRKTGVAIVRGVFPASQATDWFNDVGRYLEENEYEKKEVEKRSLDKYSRR